MRDTPRVVSLLVAAILLETSLFAVLAPLLPGLERDPGMSGGQAGLLVAMYPLGLLVAGFPAAAIAGRIGVKLTMIGGLVGLAIASVAFGVLDSLAGRMISRLAQGLAAGGVWTGSVVWLVEAASRSRRGTALGVAFGVAAAGNVIGPVFGGVAAAAGRFSVQFAGALLALALAAAAARFERPPVAERAFGMGSDLRMILTDRGMAGATWLCVVPGILLGGLLLIGPLRLDAQGVGPGGIAAVFAVAAGVGVVVRPLVGRWSDRNGRVRPIQLSAVAAALLLALAARVEDPRVTAVALVLLLMLMGVLTVTTGALLLDRSHVHQVANAVAVTVVSVAATVGIIVGSSGTGLLQEKAGQGLAFAAVAVVTLSCLAATGREPAARESDA